MVLTTKHFRIAQNDYESSMLHSYTKIYFRNVPKRVTIAKNAKTFCQKMLAQIGEPSKIASTSKIASHLQ